MVLSMQRRRVTRPKQCRSRSRTSTRSCGTPCRWHDQHVVFLDVGWGRTIAAASVATLGAQVHCLPIPKR
jgi:hypothetical protein